jgi:hypothetical protein
VIKRIPFSAVKSCGYARRPAAAMRKGTLCFLLLLACGCVQAQQPRDTSKVFIDSTAYYDELFGEMAEFLDSITAPRTFFLAEVGVSQAYFNYVKAGSYDLESKRQLTYTPSVGYFHKNGLGLNVSATVVHDGRKLNPFQLLATASYDYLHKSSFAAGGNFTRYFTKKNLPFYTTPLLNELGAYFTWKRWWLRPAVLLSYGWGSRSAYDEREAYIISLRLRPDGFTRIRTDESVTDFSAALSLRHDFYWLNVGPRHAALRLTPQLVFTSGTQKFGFNQNANTYGTVRATNLNELVATENQYLDDQLYFQPLSLTGTLKLEWSWKWLLVQPQYVANYYFPSDSQKFLSVFRFNVGFVF